MENKEVIEQLRYFKPSEFLCKCGCGQGLLQMNDLVLQKIDFMRLIMNQPIVINSAYRCAQYNRIVGGEKDSSHKKGLALDLRVLNNSHRLKLLHYAYMVGFRRFGLGKNHLHLDLDTKKPWGIMWLE